MRLTLAVYTSGVFAPFFGSSERANSKSAARVIAWRITASVVPNFITASPAKHTSASTRESMFVTAVPILRFCHFRCSDVLYEFSWNIWQVRIKLTVQAKA